MKSISFLSIQLLFFFIILTTTTTTTLPYTRTNNVVYGWTMIPSSSLQTLQLRRSNRTTGDNNNNNNNNNNNKMMIKLYAITIMKKSQVKQQHSGVSMTNHDNDNDNNNISTTNTLSRRESFVKLLSRSSVGFVTAVTLQPLLQQPALAASSSSSSKDNNNNIITPDEMKRIQIGYEQINYLLDHFEQETTVCRENGGSECKRDANAIRKVLGLRSTTDPLFQIEKVFAKIKNLNLDDDTNNNDIDITALYDAVEDWNSSISMSNSMAFISQFGEYNPGGGKDEVLKYLLESQKQVLLAKQALQTIMINLKIPMITTTTTTTTSQ